MTDHPPSTEALHRLHDSCTALLLVDEVYIPRRYVVCNTTGRPLMPLPQAWEAGRKSGRLDPADPLPMFIPEDCNDCLQLLVVPDPIDPHTNPGVDRYTAYHGRTTEPTWATMVIDTAKWPGEICEGAEITLPNPLATDEPRLCRLLNADPARLARLCEQAVATRPEAPVAVGLDPGGLDVRARFGIIRIKFPTRAADAESVLSQLQSLYPTA